MKFEDSLGVNWRTGKAIHKVKIRLDEPRAWKPFGASSNPAAASFYIRGPEPKGWHRGQNQVPFFILTVLGNVAVNFDV